MNFAQPSDFNFLTVSGLASISRDQERIDKYWNKFMEAWFEKGKEDLSIRIIKVNPGNAEYWEAKNGKMMTLIKVATSALTGQRLDTSIEGTLNL